MVGSVAVIGLLPWDSYDGWMVDGADFLILIFVFGFLKKATREGGTVIKRISDPILEDPL